MSKTLKIALVILFLLIIISCFLIIRSVMAAYYPNAPSDAGTFTTNGGDCWRRTATWIHGGDYELWLPPITGFVCSSQIGIYLEHPYTLEYIEWLPATQQWQETMGNNTRYNIHRCNEMPGGIGYGGRAMVIRHLASGNLYNFAPTNPAPVIRCFSNWNTIIQK